MDWDKAEEICKDIIAMVDADDVSETEETVEAPVREKLRELRDILKKRK